MVHPIYWNILYMNLWWIIVWMQIWNFIFLSFFSGSFNDSFGTGTGLEGLDYLDEDAIREGIAEAMQEPRTDRRSAPSRDFIQESDFQVESWSSGSDCLAPETGRFGPRMQFP